MRPYHICIERIKICVELFPLLGGCARLAGAAALAREGAQLGRLSPGLLFTVKTEELPLLEGGVPLMHNNQVVCAVGAVFGRSPEGAMGYLDDLTPERVDAGGVAAHGPHFLLVEADRLATAGAQQDLARTVGQRHAHQPVVIAQVDGDDSRGARA